SIFGSVLYGFGIGLTLTEGASTGGTDIIAMIIKKYASINISKALFLADFIIVMLTAFVFGIETWLFSLIGFVAKLLFVNNTLESMNLSKYCTVITSPEYEDQICDFITHTLKKTATVSSAYTGAYNGDQKSVLLVALTRKQAIHLKKFVKELDEKSFIIINNTSEISGRGFHEMV
ncbi:MAG: YitT family protein, partial [Oscillospiraceae bacterium]|nr:YitT family protein [Oscillospiraceae bacterium]